MNKDFELIDLDQFCGTQIWYKHSLLKDILYTEGVHYVAERAGAYWLIDEIALAQKFEPKVGAEKFQVWILYVENDATAELICEDGNNITVFEKQIEYTDFPLPEIKFYYTDNVIMLPGEY